MGWRKNLRMERIPCVKGRVGKQCMGCGHGWMRECERKEAALCAAAGAAVLDLHLQMQIGVPTDRVDGVEALLRAVGHDGKPIPPPLVVASAENAGLGAVLGLWSLERAAVDAMRLEHAGFPVPVRVNLQEDQVLDCAFVAKALAFLRTYGRYVEIEIVESVRSDDLAGVLAGLRALRDAGGVLHMDDYIGDAGDLERLDSGLFDCVKIDRSFMEMARSAGTHDALSRVVSDLRPYGAKVLLEGLETHDDLALAREAGLTLYQGWAFHKPAPCSQLIERLRSDEAWRREAAKREAAGTNDRRAHPYGRRAEDAVAHAALSAVLEGALPPSGPSDGSDPSYGSDEAGGAE